jgi:hypothetical protein
MAITRWLCLWEFGWLQQKDLLAIYIRGLHALQLTLSCPDQSLGVILGYPSLNRRVVNLRVFFGLDSVASISDCQDFREYGIVNIQTKFIRIKDHVHFCIVHFLSLWLIHGGADVISSGSLTACELQKVKHMCSAIEFIYLYWTILVWIIWDRS